MILAAGHEVVRFSGQVGGECGREERDVQMFKPGFFFFLVVGKRKVGEFLSFDRL